MEEGFLTEIKRSCCEVVNADCGWIQAIENGPGRHGGIPREQPPLLAVDLYV
jgi:hypothetical protein